VDNAGDLLEGLKRDGIVEAASPRYRLPSTSAALMNLPIDAPATAQGLTQWCDAETDANLISAAAPAIVSAIGSAVQAGDHKAAIALGRSADGAVSLSGHWGIWGQLLDATREAAIASTDPFAEGWSLHQLGTRALAEQRHDEALSMLTEAADIRRRIGDTAGLNVTEHNLSLLSAAPAAVPPHPPASAPSSSSGIPWWAWTMIFLGLLAVGGIVGFVVANQDPEVTVVTTVAAVNGELVTREDVVRILDVPVGASVAGEVELINTGGGPVDIDAVSVDGHGSITADSACGSLEPGDSCLVTVRFSPQEPGEVDAHDIIEHTGINDDLGIPVIGIAVEPPEAFLIVDPINLDFGVIPLGEDDTASIEIMNAGELDVHIHDIGIDSDAFVRDEAGEEFGRCADLDPGDSCSIDVRFVAAVPGVFDGVLIVDHSGENSPSEVRLSGIVPEPANLVIEIVDVVDATNESVTDTLTTGSVTVSITNIGQTATREAFEYRIERLDPSTEDSWVPTITFEERPAMFVFEGSIGPDEIVIFEDVSIGFPTGDYFPESGFKTQIRAEVDSCFGERLIDIPPCRVAESNEQDNVSEPATILIFFEVLR
jgi:hypothetical protein